MADAPESVNLGLTIPPTDPQFAHLTGLGRLWGMLIGKEREGTIASGALLVSSAHMQVKSETGTSDDLDTIDGLGDGHIVTLRAATSHTITIKDGTGNIETRNNADVILDDVGDVWMGLYVQAEKKVYQIVNNASSNLLNLIEITTPASPAVDSLNLFARDDGNRIQLVVQSALELKVIETLLNVAPSSPADPILTVNWVEE